MKKKNKGFTLLELIIVLAVSAIVMTIITSMFMSGLRIFSNSNVKTTLQMDAKDVQERISNICMQAESIESVSGDKETGEITELIINSYDNNQHIIEKKSDGKLEIEGFKVPSKISSMKINKEIIDGDLSKFNSISFNIELEGKEGFSDDIRYPVKFEVAFRNKNISK